MFRSDSEGYNRPIAIDQQIIRPMYRCTSNVSKRCLPTQTPPEYCRESRSFYQDQHQFGPPSAATERVNDAIGKDSSVSRRTTRRIRALGERLESQKMANGGYGDKQLELGGNYRADREDKPRPSPASYGARLQ